MKNSKQKQFLIIAAAILAICLQQDNSFAVTTNVDSGTATANTTTGNVTYGGKSYSWNIDKGDILILDGGTLSVTARTTGVANGILQATTGKILMNQGSYAGFTTLTLHSGSSILQDVVLDIRSYSSILLNGGELYVGSDDDFRSNSSIQLQNGTLYLQDANSGFSVQATGGTIELLSGTLDILSTTYASSSIASEVVINTALDTLLQVTSGNLYISSNDNIQGGLSLVGANGNIYIDGSNYTPNSYTQTSGNLNLQNSEFTLNSSSEVTGGNINLDGSSVLNIQNGKESTVGVNASDGDSVNISNSSTLNLNSGNIQKDADLSVDSTSGINVSGTGAVLNIDSQDNYSGKLGVNGGTVNLFDKDFSSNELEVTSGSLNLDKSTVTFNGQTSSLAGGELNLTNSSELNITNTEASSSLNTTDATSNKINITDNSTFTMLGGAINEAAQVNIADGSKFVLDSSSASLSIDNNDTWGGDIELSNGNLNIIGHQILTSEGQNYTQYLGTLTLTNSELTLDTPDSFITGGNIVLNSDSSINIMNGMENSAAINNDGKNSFSIGNSSSFAMTSGVLSEDADISVGSGSSLTLHDGASVTIDSSDKWDGTVISDGSLTVKDKDIVTDDSVIYQQGTLGQKGSLVLDNSGMVLNEGSYTEAGTINLLNDASLTYQNNRNNYASITTDELSNSSVTLASGSSLVLNGGNIYENAKLDISGDLQVSGASIVLDSATDNWDGTISLFKGNVLLKNIDKTSGFAQVGGVLELIDTSINLNTENDILDGGNISMNQGSNLIISNNKENQTDFISTDTSANGLTINNDSTYDIKGGNISQQTAVNVESGSALSVSGASVVLDKDTDSLNGSLSLHSGDISINNFNNGDSIITDGSRLYNQDGGTLNLNSTSLTLNDGSVISNGTVNLTQNSSIAFSNGVENSGTLNLNDSTTNTLLLEDNSTLSLVGGIINDAASVTIDSGSTLNLNGAGVNVAITGEDVWQGNLNLSSGTLSIKDGFHSSDANKTYTQTGGTLNLNGSSIQLNTSESYVSNGNINLSNNSMLVFDNSYDNAANITTTDSSLNNLTVYEGSNLTLTGGNINKEANVTIDYGSDINVKGATLSLNSGDVWSGGVNLRSGSVTLSDALNKVTTADNFYTQTDGTLYIDNASLTLNTKESYITGGLGYLQNSGSLTISNGLDTNSIQLYANDGTASSLSILNGSTLKLTDGSIAESANVTIDNTSSLNISDGTVDLNSSTGDDWSGKIEQNGGTLNLSGFNRDNGTLVSQTGNLNLNENAKIELAAGSQIVSNTRINIADTSELHISGGSTTINSGDIWTGDIFLTDGSLSYTSLTQNGNIYADGGRLSVYRTSGKGILYVEGDSYINSGTEVSLTGSANIVVGSGGKVYFNQGDNWASGTLITINDGGLFDYSDLTSGGNINGSGGVLDIHSGIFNLSSTVSYISQAVALTLDEGATISVSSNNASSGGLTINQGTGVADDVWNGDIEQSGGTINLVGVDKQTSGTSAFNQTGGILNLTAGTNLVLNEGSSIKDSSVVKFASSGDTSSLTIANGLSDNKADLNTSGRGDSFIIDNNSTFTHVNGTVSAADNVSIKEGSSYNLEGSSSSKIANLYLNEGDEFSGNVNLTSGYGRLYIDNISKSETAALIQSATNAVTTVTGENFVLNNALDNISAGSFVIGDGSSGTVLGISAGSIQDGAKVSINKNSTVNLSGGYLSLNSGDVWSGSILQSGGTLNYDKLTSNGIINSNGGNFNITGNSTLDVSAGSSIGADTNLSLESGSNINITNNGNVTVNSGDSWSGNIHNTGGIVNVDGTTKNSDSVYIQDDADSILNVTGQGFNLSNSSDSISQGLLNIGNDEGALSDFTLSNGSVADEVKVNVYDNASLIIDGGNLTLSDVDNIDGKLDLRDGQLTLRDFILNSDFVQTGGILDLYSSELHLSEVGSAINGSVYLNDGSVVDFNSGTENNVELITDNSANKIDIQSGKVTLTGESIVNNASVLNLAGRGELNISQGTVNLNNNDTWAGTIFNSSELNIDNLSKTGSLVQENSSAVTNITGSGFDLNSFGDSISAGSLNIGNGQTSGKLTISAGSVGEDANLNLAENSAINVDGGTLTLDSADIWAGDISALAGTINVITDIDRTGALTVDGGTINFYSAFTLNGQDVLNSGSVNLYGNLNLVDEANLSSDIALNINNYATLDIDESSIANVGQNDNWRGSINNKGILNLSLSKTTSASSVYTQDGGTLNISDSAQLILNSGSSIINNGEVNLTENSEISFNNSTNNSAVINTVDNTNNVINVTNGATLDLGDGTNINSQAKVDFSGDVSISNGNLVLNTGDVLAGDLSNNGANVTFDGVNKTGAYIQNSSDAILNILSDMTLSDIDKINSGSLSIDGANLTLDGLSITDLIDVSLAEDAKLTILQGSDVYLSSDDTLLGSIDNSGNLTVKDITLGNSYSHNNAQLIMDNSTFNSKDGVINGGSITLNNNSELNISNSAQNTVGVVTDGSNNKLGITNNSTLVMESGNIIEDSILNIESGSTLRLEDASVSINDNSATADIWDGTIELTTANSTLRLVDYTSPVGKLIAEQGNLILDGTTILSLRDGSIAEAVALDIGTDATLYLSGASLNLDSSDKWGGKIIMNNSSSSLTLTDIVTDDASSLIAQDGSLILDNSTLNLTGTSQISSEVDVTIEADSTLNISGGNVTLDGLTDKWEGKLTISDGNLTLDNMVKDENGIFEQTGGTTTILGTSFDMNNSGDFVKDGTLIVGDGINEALLTVSKGTIYDDATLVIKDNAEVNIITDGSSGESGSGSGGLDWSGHVQVDGGKLTIADTEKTGTLTQTGGEIVVSGSGFDLNRSEDNLSGGSLVVDGNLGVSAGTIGANNNLTINEDGQISINGGSVTVNGGDVWNGLVDVTAGNMFIDSFIGDVSYSQSGGNLSVENASNITLGSGSLITGGQISIDNSSIVSSIGSSINDADVILNNNSSLTISNSDINNVNYSSDDSNNKLTISDSSTLNLNSGKVKEQTIVDIQEGSNLSIKGDSSVVIDSNTGSADNWAGEITLVDDNSTLILKDYVKSGTSSLNAEKGNFILDGKTILTLEDGTIAQLVKLTINEDARLNLSGGSLTLDSQDTWLGTIGMDNSSSSLTLDGMNIGDDANLIATEGNLILQDSVLTIGGTSNIDNNVNLNIDADSTVNLAAGDLYINDGDTWSGKINNNGGNLTIDKNTTNKDGILSQTVGSANTTVLGATFDLNNVLDSISSGSLVIGNGVDNAVLTISNGTVSDGADVNITNNSQIIVSGGNLTLASGDIYDGEVSITNGTLILGDVSKTGILSQTGGQINVSNNFDMNNAADSLTGGRLSLGANSKFTVSDGTISEGSAITMGNGAELAVNGGNVALNNNDSWTEKVSVNGGTLNISDVVKTGELVQTSGLTNILEDFTLNNSQDNISGGRLSISDGANLTVSNGNVTSQAEIVFNESSKITVSGGNIELNENDAWGGAVEQTGGNITVSGFDNNSNKNGIINSNSGKLTIGSGYLTIGDASSIGNNTQLIISNGSTLDITGGDAAINSNDTWSGNVSISDGNLAINDVDKTTSSGSSFTQSGGNLNMNGSNLTINDSNSSITNGNLELSDSNLTMNDGVVSDSEISLGDNSGINISNGNTNSGSITTDGTSNNIEISGNDTVLDITGGTIDKSANVTIGSGSTVNITDSSANVTLDGLTDKWEGKLTISDGNLTLDNMVKDENGIFEQTGGTTTILGTSFDMNNSGDFVKDGTLIVGDGINEALLTVSKGTIYDDATLVIKDNAEVNIITDGSSGESGSGSGGLDWSGHVQVDGGKLTIADTEKTGTLTQTGGEIVVSGSGFDLNRSEDNLSGGSLVVDGNLGVSAGTIGANNNLTINEDGQISINGGSVTVNGGDVWNGLVDITDGDLILDGADKTGILTQTGGDTVIVDDFNLNNSSDLISGGNLTIQEGTLTISQGTVSEGANVNINKDANISVEGGNLSLDNDDIWNGNVSIIDGNLTVSEIEDKIGSLTQTGGTTTVDGDFNLNNSNDTISGGNLVINNGSDLTVSAGNIESGANLDINSGSGLIIAGGNVQIDNSDNWSGDVTLSSGNLTISQDKNTTSDSSYNQSGGTLELTSDLILNSGSSITDSSIINITNGNLTISNNTQNQGSITTDNNSSLTISDGSSLSLVGGVIADDSILNVSGDLSISGSDTVVNIGTNDSWLGNVSIAGGSLNLTTDKITSSDSTFNQTGGKLSITGSNLTLNNGSSVSGGEISLDNSGLTSNSGSSITSSEITMNNNSSLVIDNGKDNTASINTDTTSNSITIADGSNLGVIGGEIVSETELGIYGDLGIYEGATVTVDGTDVWEGKISIADGTLILENVTQAGEFEAESGTLKILGSNTSLGKGLVVNKGVTTIIDSNSTLDISGGSVTFDANKNSTDDWSGSITMDSGSFVLTDNFIHQTENGTYNQTGGTLQINNGASLTINDAISSITDESKLVLGDKGTLSIANGGSHNAELQTSGNSNFQLSENSTFTTTGETSVAASTNISIASGSTLNVESGNVELDRIGLSTQTDNWSGKINVKEDGKLTLVNSSAGIGNGGNISSSMLEQSGGTLSLNNTVLNLYENTDDILKSGTVELDKYSRINLGTAWANSNIDIKSAGTIAAANGVIEANSLGGLIIDNVNGRSDFTIDIYEDSINGTYTADTFDFTSIIGADSSKEAVINISDWNLIKSNPNYTVGSQTVDLGKIFDTENLGDNIKFTTTADEVLTPVNRYQLIASDANDGSYLLEVLGYNKQAFRGQVVTTAQMMNQLVINDIMFDRMMLSPQTLTKSSIANKLAIQDVDAVLPGYEYTRRDPGFWVKSYGNFETLRMTEDLAVENSAYGSLVGLDMGTLDLGKGWSWIPTIYMGYTGAHQSFEGVSAYENGGQIGAMATFFNKNWITSVLGYASLYNVEMSLQGSNDQDINYYAGTAVKGAYNWRIKNKFIVQPSATVSYNFFGGQNWKSDYGQIGMTTGTLNGLNVAPGVNFIWQEETWNIFATVAYVYNCVGGVSGKAAGVDLPEVWMNRGYLQYGFGISKEITDRFSAFVQVVLRNVGRTGIGFQGELEYRF